MAGKKPAMQREAGKRERQTTVRLAPWLGNALADERKLLAGERGDQVTTAQLYRELVEAGCGCWDSYGGLNQIAASRLQQTLNGIVADEGRETMRTVTVPFPPSMEARLEVMRASLERAEKTREKNGEPRPTWWPTTLRHGELTLADTARVALLLAVATRRLLRKEDEPTLAGQRGSAPPAPARASELRRTVFEVLEKAERTKQELKEGTKVTLAGLQEVFEQLRGTYNTCLRQDLYLALPVGHQWEELGAAALAHHAGIDDENHRRLETLHNNLIEIHRACLKEVLEKPALPRGNKKVGGVGS